MDWQVKISKSAKKYTEKIEAKKKDLFKGSGADKYWPGYRDNC